MGARDKNSSLLFPARLAEDECKPTDHIAADIL